MMSEKKRYQPGNLSGWLLVAMLSFSVCTFAGFVANSFSQHRQSARVESLITNGKQSDAGTVSYDQVAQLPVRSLLPVLTNAWILKIAMHHTRSCEIILDQNSKLLSGFKSATDFLPLKLIFSSSDPDDPYLPVG